ncbi:bifunctional diguanylate cyclase/phosphodiesterase [Methylobacterium sp. P31]
MLSRMKMPDTMPSLSGWLRVAACVVGLGIPALLTWTLDRQYNQALADAETRVVNTAGALGHHASRSFETIDTYLRAVVSLVGPRADTIPVEALHAALHEQFVRSDLNNIIIIDRDGRALVEAVAFPARPLDVSDRSYFQTLRDRPGSGLLVGNPIVGRLTGKLLLPVARRIDNPDGSFAGLVQAMLDPETFQTVYATIHNGPGATLNLWRADGTLLVRSPRMPEVIGRNFGAASNYRAHVPVRDDKPFWSHGMTDGVVRVIAYSFLDAYSLYVSAAISRADALADWRRSAVTQGAVAGSLTIVLVGALLLLAREIERRQSADAQIRASEARLRLSEERLALAIESGEDGIWDWDLRSDEVWVSDHWMRRLSREGCQRIAMRTFERFVDPQDRTRVAVALREHVKGLTPSFICEHRILCLNGGHLWVLTRGRVVERDARGRAVRMVGTQIDISRRKEAEARVEHLAYHDALTGLPNRLLFRERLDRAIHGAEAAPCSYAVTVCDLDGFKAVNDTFGHVVGDRLLCAVAERIRSVLSDADTAARLGGDEFALVLGGLDGEPSARRMAERIINTVSEPIEIDGTQVEVGVSLGLAMVQEGQTDADEVFRRADAALYGAKAAGRGTYRLFQPGAHARAAERSSLALDIKEAIRRGDFSLVYQPVIDVTTNAVVSFEALMRWHHPERGSISPADFIPAAEETGLIVQLGTWALAEACRETRRWPDSIRVAVNVSPVQIRDGLEEAVMLALAGAGLDSRRLTLEVTESVLMRDADDALARLHRLRGLGIEVALDDFGTGFSSLGYLRRFPFDKIKLDRAFIRDIADPEAAAIVRAVTDLSRRLGKRVVVEGVETAEQLERVRQEGCAEVQGFLFSRPLSAADAAAFAASGARRRAA